MKPPIDLGKLENWELNLVMQLNALEAILSQSADKLPPVIGLISAIDDFRDALSMKLCNESR
jgi:hypothetical protein